MKKLTNALRDFWLDYSASHYAQLRKRDAEPGLDIFLHSAITLSLNLNTVLILIFYAIGSNFIKKEYMIITGLLVVFGLYLWVKKNNAGEIIQNRKPKYHWIYYRIYTLLSVILFMLAGYYVSPYR